MTALKLTTNNSAYAKRKETKRIASRVIRAYKSGHPIPEGDALICAVAASELLTICELAVRSAK